jgi:hypothetical protein
MSDNATDRLRELLDERGVEWNDGGEGLTIIPVQYGVPRAWTVNTWPSGKDMGDCLWVQNRHPLTPEQAVAATVGAQEVYLLMGTDTYDGREYVLGVFSTEEEAEAAIGDNRYGYGLHNVQRWVVDA